MIAPLAAPDVSRENATRPRELRLIDIDAIDVATNVRAELGDLAELAASIRSRGLLQPVTVSPSADGRYRLAIGHRRLAAAREAGLTQVPALVDPEPTLAEGATRLIEQLIENLQRADLNALDEARALRAILDGDRSLKQAALAAQLGKSAPWVANTLALLKAPQALQDDVASGRLSAAHVRAIASLPQDEQVRIAGHAISEGLSAHDLEDQARLIRERDADVAKRAKESKAAGGVAVEALRAAEVSTDVPVWVRVRWDLERDEVARAVSGAGWNVTDEGWPTKPNEHCTCRTMSVFVADLKTTEVGRVCVSDEHRQAGLEVRDRERREREQEAERERGELGEAIVARLRAVPLDPTVGRLVLRRLDNYNGDAWTKYSAMSPDEIAQELAKRICRDSYGAKPIPHAKVLEALGHVAPAAAAKPALPSGRKPRPQVSTEAMSVDQTRKPELNDPLVVAGVKYRIRAIADGRIHVRQHFSPHAEMDVAPDLTWDDVAGVWRGLALTDPVVTEDSALDDVAETVEAARVAGAS